MGINGYWLINPLITINRLYYVSAPACAKPSIECYGE